MIVPSYFFRISCRVIIYQFPLTIKYSKINIRFTTCERKYHFMRSCRNRYLFIETSIIEKNLVSVLGGQKADVSIDAFPGEKIEGKVLSVSPEALTTSRMVPVRIGLPSYLNRKLKPGLSATCDVTIFSKNVLIIPQTCLAEGKDSVFVIVSSNTVHKQEVKTGYRSRDYVEITAGLTEGDLVVISPDYAGVQEGNKVRYTQPEEYKTESK